MDLDRVKRRRHCGIHCLGGGLNSHAHTLFILVFHDPEGFKVAVQIELSLVCRAEGVVHFLAGLERNIRTGTIQGAHGLHEVTQNARRRHFD